MRRFGGLYCCRVEEACALVLSRRRTVGSSSRHSGSLARFVLMQADQYSRSDGTIQVWDLQARRCISSLKPHTAQITSIKFSPDRRLFSASCDGSVLIAELDNKYKMVSPAKLFHHNHTLDEIMLLPVSDQYVIRSGDAIRVYANSTGALVRQIAEHRGMVSSLAVHPNGLLFASGGYECSVIIRSSETFEALRTIEFSNRIESVLFDDAEGIYVGVTDRGVVECNTRTGEILSTMATATGIVNDLALTSSCKGALCLDVLPS